MLDENPEKSGFLICDDGEQLSVLYAHWEFSRMVKGFFYPMVVITDGSRSLIAAKSLRRVCEDLAKFHGDIHCTFLVRTVEFDCDGGGIAIINEFDFYGMCYKAFAVRFRVCGLLCISEL